MEAKQIWNKHFKYTFNKDGGIAYGEKSIKIINFTIGIIKTNEKNKQKRKFKRKNSQNGVKLTGGQTILNFKTIAKQTDSSFKLVYLVIKRMKVAGIIGRFYNGENNVWIMYLLKNSFKTFLSFLNSFRIINSSQINWTTIESNESNDENDKRQKLTKMIKEMKELM